MSLGRIMFTLGCGVFSLTVPAGFGMADFYFGAALVGGLWFGWAKYRAIIGEAGDR